MYMLRSLVPRPSASSAPCAEEAEGLGTRLHVTCARHTYMYTVLSIPKKLGISILYTIVPNTINTLMQERKRRAKFSYNIYVSTCTPVFSGSLEEHREG